MNDLGDPTVALICSLATGFYFISGDVHDRDFNGRLPQLLFEDLSHEAGWFGIVAGPKEWVSAVIDFVCSGVTVERGER